MNTSFPIDGRVTACIVIGGLWGGFAKAMVVPPVVFYPVAIGLGAAIALVTIGLSYLRRNQT